MDLVERVQLTFDATETEVVYMASSMYYNYVCKSIAERS